MSRTEEEVERGGAEQDRGTSHTRGVQHLSHIYHRRRGIPTEEEFLVDVSDIFVYEGSLVIEICEAEETWYWLIPVDKVENGNKTLSRLLRICDEKSEAATDFDALSGESLQLSINEGKDAASLAGVDEEHEFAHVSTSHIPEEDRSRDFETISDDVRLNAQLLSGGGGYIKGETGSCEAVGEEKFRLPVYTRADEPLYWEFELDPSASPEHSDAARVIESLGGGEIKYIKGETVYVVPSEKIVTLPAMEGAEDPAEVHKRVLERRRAKEDRELSHRDEIKTVGEDTTGKWELVLPRDCREVRELENEEEMHVDTSQPSTVERIKETALDAPLVTFTGKVFNAVKSPVAGIVRGVKMYKRALVFGLIAYLFYSIQPFISQQISTGTPVGEAQVAQLVVLITAVHVVMAVLAFLIDTKQKTTQRRV
jgi:hypothetical protein